MRFEKTAIAGVFEVILEPSVDERGLFARSWCKREFNELGLEYDVVQTSLSHNFRRGTLRGMHFQWPPSTEAKLVRCERGAAHDVVLDLRPDSPSFLQHVAIQLKSTESNSVYIPPGVAHGFQAMADNTRVHYMMTDYHAPELAGGVRFDDPAFAIEWPLPVSVISEKDATWPDFDAAAHVENLKRCQGRDAWRLDPGSELR